MYFDDFKVGQRFTTASHVITEEEIIDFARQWDKQPFHLDKEAAAKTIYGGLIASGFHTLMISFNLIVERAVWTKCSQGSPGMEDLRWILPVRPGDELTVDFKVVKTTPSRSRDDRGYVLWDHSTRNQNGEVVMTFRSAGICLKEAAVLSG